MDENSDKKTQETPSENPTEFSNSGYASGDDSPEVRRIRALTESFIKVDLPPVRAETKAKDGLCMDDRFYLKWPVNGLGLKAGETITLIEDPRTENDYLAVSAPGNRLLLVSRRILVKLQKLKGANDN